MQRPVKASGCQHLSFPNHDIGNRILGPENRGVVGGGGGAGGLLPGSGVQDGRTDGGIVEQ